MSLTMKMAASLLLSTGLLVLCSCKKKEAALPERTVNVVVMEPLSRKFEERIRVQANIEAQEKAAISSRVDGNLEVLRVGTGSRVKKGDLLFQVDHLNLENDVKVQQAKLEVAKSEYHIATINLELAKTVSLKAKNDFDRSEKLYQSRAVSEDAYERQSLNYQESEANIRKASAQQNYSSARLQQEEAALKIAEKKLADSTITAPFDGVLVDKFKEQGEYVRVGNEILKLENHKVLELSAFISAAYYDQIKPGVTEAVIYNIDGSKLGEAKVSYRSPNIDAISRTFELKVLLPEVPNFVSGMLCDVDIILRASQGQGVPTEAILSRNDDSKVVFVADGERAEPVNVTTGIVDGKYSEILNIKDLKARPVIVEGQTFLGAGDKIVDVSRRGAKGN